jgi:hypothetical protein
MQLYVQFTVFEHLTGKDTVAHLRYVVGEQLGTIKQSGKLVSGGIFADARGGYMVLNINDSTELGTLLGGAFIDHFNIVSHPLMTFDQLGEFFKNHPPK